MKHLLIVGCGQAGRRHAREFIERGWKVWGVDPDPSILSDWPGHGWSGELEPLLAALEGHFDAAVVATPPHTHLDVACECIRHGLKAILIEKPLCGWGQWNVFQREAIVWSRLGTRVMVAYNYRWHPVTRKIKLAWDAGEVGDMLSMSSRASRDPVPVWGVVLDQLSHAVDALRFMAGQEPTVEKVYRDRDGMWVDVTGWIRRPDRRKMAFSITESMVSTDGRQVTWEYLTPQGDQVCHWVDADATMFREMTDHFEAVAAGEAPPFPTVMDALGTQAILEVIERRGVFT